MRGFQTTAHRDFAHTAIVVTYQLAAIVQAEVRDRSSAWTMVGDVPTIRVYALPRGLILEMEVYPVPGTRRSGRKGLGSALLADAIYEHLRQGADLLRARCPGGLRAIEEAWVEQCQALVMQAELDAAKTALARSLLEGDDVTDACLRLAKQHRERYGPLIEVFAEAA